MSKQKALLLLLNGILGCLCFGCGDWLMIYADHTAHGALFWLTEGTAQIAPWRNTLAMALAFPGIIFYALALFALASFITDNNSRTTYRALTVIGLLPWLALHLFYIMILALFAWMNANISADIALQSSEMLYNRFSWIITVSEIFMILPFIYWFYLQISAKTIFPRVFALSNVLLIYLILSLSKFILPVSAFRLGCINGLMSESMLFFFAFNYLGGYHYYKIRNFF